MGENTQTMKPERSYCTLSDKNYLLNGMALIESLIKHSSEKFKLYYLCLDEETFTVLKNLNYPHVFPIRMSELEKTQDFETLKANTSYIENSHECTYCFALASFFSEYLVSNKGLKEILYIDSDIIFYQDPRFIFEEIGDRSIGVMLHRHVPIGHHVGGYNVGVVYFKNNSVGYKCLKWWRDCVMNPKNEWFDPYGRVGDQTYLEAFGKLFGDKNLSVIDHSIGHGAPWNFWLYEYDEDEIIWEGRRQKMSFIHFSHFCPDFTGGSYTPDRDGEWGSLVHLKHPRVKKYYDDYFFTLKSMSEKLEKYKIGETL